MPLHSLVPRLVSPEEGRGPAPRCITGGGAGAAEDGVGVAGSEGEDICAGLAASTTTKPRRTPANPQSDPPSPMVVSPRLAFPLLRSMMALTTSSPEACLVAML